MTGYYKPDKVILHGSKYLLVHLALSGLTLSTGEPHRCTNGRGANNINIHCDVTGLLTAVWRSHTGQIVWAA